MPSEHFIDHFHGNICSFGVNLVETIMILTKEKAFIVEYYFLSYEIRCSNEQTCYLNKLYDKRAHEEPKHVARVFNRSSV